MKMNRLVVILTQVQRLLKKHEDIYYLPVIDDLLIQYDGRAEEFRSQVADVLFSRGGMGSPSDLRIMKENGHKVDRVKETNMELQALFDVAYYETNPPDQKGTIKHFDRYPSTHAEWEVELTSNKIESIFDVLIFITYFHTDWRWVQLWCLYFTYHSNQDLRALAARCLVDIAKLQQELDSGIVLTRMGELMNDPEIEVQMQAIEAAKTLHTILNVTSSTRSTNG